jgi:hypothetical protein
MRGAVVRVISMQGKSKIIVLRWPPNYSEPSACLRCHSCHQGIGSTPWASHLYQLSGMAQEMLYMA